MLTLDQINAASPIEVGQLLEGVYEHSPWIAEAAAVYRPFKSLSALKHAMAAVVRTARRDQQLALVRAHPELAGKAMVSRTLTAESTDEQGRAGLTDCTPEEYERLLRLNADYNQKFGWPFILAVRGPRGIGLSRDEIIKTFERRLAGQASFELAECLRNIHRIAEIRLNDKFGHEPAFGNLVLDWADELAQFSEPSFLAQGQLTVTYLTAAHRACAGLLAEWMRSSCGFDEVSIDAVGNVVGIYRGEDPASPRLLTGSHYDTVRNGGKYDGRLGIFVPMACVRELKRQGRRLPFGIEVVGFAEEEGQRYRATFLGSGALVGQFDPRWLDQRDQDGVALRDAMEGAGLKIADIPSLQRRAESYRGFIEVHIEQGPVLNEEDVPLGVVTSINGSVRFSGEAVGMASHAGTTPMGRRRDAAAAVAELVLWVERSASAVVDAVGTVGQLEVPSGSVNVVPGVCRFSLDIRATSNGVRDAVTMAILTEWKAICARREITGSLVESMRASAAPSDPGLRQRWEDAVNALGVPLIRLPSGAGHDAMKMHDLMPQAMLFVRGGNLGISHNPLETVTNDDADLAVRAFQKFIENMESV